MKMYNQKIFIQKDFKSSVPDLEQVNGEVGGRYYRDPDGNKYHSVTKILDTALDKSGLIKWRERIGDEEADKIMKESQIRGKFVHDFSERYVLNENYDNSWEKSKYAQYCQAIKDSLDQNLDAYYAVEKNFCSKKYAMAGQVDLIGIWNGKVSVVDTKTAFFERKMIKEKRQKYFLQMAMYSEMIKEQTDLEIEQFVIVAGFSDSTHRNYSVGNNDKWSEYIEKIIKNFNKRYKFM